MLKNKPIKGQLAQMGFTDAETVMAQALHFEGVRAEDKGDPAFRWTTEFLREVFADLLRSQRVWVTQLREALRNHEVFGTSHLNELRVAGQMPAMPILLDQALRTDFSDITILMTRVLHVFADAQVGLIRRIPEYEFLLKWDIEPSRAEVPQEPPPRRSRSPLVTESPRPRRPTRPAPTVAPVAGIQPTTPKQAIEDLIKRLDDYGLHALKVLGLYCNAERRINISALPLQAGDSLDVLLDLFEEYDLIYRVGQGAQGVVWQVQLLTYERALRHLVREGRYFLLPSVDLPLEVRIQWVKDESEALQRMQGLLTADTERIQERLRELQAQAGRLAETKQAATTEGTALDRERRMMEAERNGRVDLALEALEADPAAVVELLQRLKGRVGGTLGNLLERLASEVKKAPPEPEDSPPPPKKYRRSRFASENIIELVAADFKITVVAMRDPDAPAHVITAARVAVLLVAENDPTMTQKEIGALFNRSQPTISQWLRNMGREKIEKNAGLRKRVERLMNELGISPTQA